MPFIQILWIGLLLQSIYNITATDPKFDPTTRMRLVLVPADAAIGSVIYRLRATDDEYDYPLQFELVGDSGSSSTVQIETLPCTKYNSVCQANVVLTRRLEAGRYYDFQVSVKDTKGGMAQQGCSITATNFTTPHDVIFPHKTGIIMIPEDAKRGTELDYVIARKNPQVSKHAYLELFGSPLFAIRQKIASPETTEGTIFLLGPLDFETQSMYHLTVLANDAYAEPDQDTRNIAGLEVVVIVQDVQDVPPIFTHAPPVTRLLSGLLPGDKVLQVHAEDGDKGNPREIRYGLVSEGNPFTSFFDINDTSGEISLLRPLDEISAITHVGDPVLLTVIAEEVKVMRDEPPAMASTVQLAFFLPEKSNSAPYFENDHYIGRLNENSPQGTALVFSDPYVPRVYDDDSGKNGVFSLTLLGNNGTFEITPNVAERRASFLLRVRDNQLLDYETRHTVQFQIVAQELGPATNLSAIVNVTIYIDDINDNPPTFDLEMYTIEVAENMTAGTKIVQVHATDIDTGPGGRIKYTQILGYLNTSLNLDPLTGIITVTSDKHGFDRELMPEYHLYVEARDNDGLGNSAQVPLVIKLIDINDNAPVFEKSLYEFILAANLREFTSPAVIRANDIDAEEPNNIVRYELIKGNYETTFLLNEMTGELTLRTPLMLHHPLTLQRRRKRQLPQIPVQSIDDSVNTEVYVLTARAYDLGVPVLSSTTTIRIYPPESKSRTVMFIVAGDNPDIKKTEESLSAITGGHVVIHSIKPYTGSEPGATNIGGDSQDKSVVVASVMYDTSSLVDISQIQNKINNNLTSTAKTAIDIQTKEDHTDDSIFRAENRFLFWILIGLALIIALSILTLLFCCICAWCPLYAGSRKRVINRVNSTEDDVHLVHRELGVGKQTKSVQVAEWMGRREAWSAQKSSDSRTKPTQWEFSKRVNDIQKLRDEHEHELEKSFKSAEEKRSVKLKNTNHQSANETQFHHSTTNLINDAGDILVEDIVEDEHHQNLKKQYKNQEEIVEKQTIYVNDIRKEHIEVEQQDKLYTNDEYQMHIDNESVRRHETNRGSDIEYENIKSQRDNNNKDADDDGDDDNNEQQSHRDQLYIKDGNAEILRLVTRGKNTDDGIYVNIPPAQTFVQPQYIMVENSGKEILMKRFIEEQTGGKPQLIREHYHIIQPGDQFIQHNIHQHQPSVMPNEVLQHEIYMNKSSQPGSITISNIDGHHQLNNNNTQRLLQTRNLTSSHPNLTTQPIIDGIQMQPAISNNSLIQQELETSLKQQNALLRQILLEKEKLEEKYHQQEAAMETQSLPSHTFAIATQTDCEACTQTEPFETIKPKRRRARSENDDSLSDDDNVEYIRYSPPNSPHGIYWIKRKRHKKKNNNNNHKPRRRVVMVEDVKRKIRTPIKEESEDFLTQTPPYKGYSTSQSPSSVKKSSRRHRSTSALKKEILMEISNSIEDDESPKVSSHRKIKHKTKQIEYYVESDDDESDNDIVVRHSAYSVDSLDDYSENEEDERDTVQQTTNHRTKTRSKTNGMGSQSDTADLHYRKNENNNHYKQRRSESITSIPIMKLSRKDSTNKNYPKPKESQLQTRHRQMSEPSHRLTKGPAPKPPTQTDVDESTKLKKVTKKFRSETDLVHRLAAEEDRHIPKYMEWYYKQQDQQQQQHQQHPSSAAISDKNKIINKKHVGAIEKKIKAKAPQYRNDMTKKPEPMPRTMSQSSIGPTISTTEIPTPRMLREDVQMNKNNAPKIQTDTNHPLLQYSEHRFEREYNPAPDLPIAPVKLPHYMYPETPPLLATNRSEGNKKNDKPTTSSSINVTIKSKPSPIQEHKDYKIVIPIESSEPPQNTTNGNTKQLNASTLEDDHDSGIAMNSMLYNMGRRNPIADKKSVFTIAYDDVQVKKIQSESDSPQY